MGGGTGAETGTSCRYCSGPWGSGWHLEPVPWVACWAGGSPRSWGSACSRALSQNPRQSLHWGKLPECFQLVSPHLCPVSMLELLPCSHSWARRGGRALAG